MNGIELQFNADLIDVSKNGDLQICIDADTVRGAVPRAWPSYHFHKRPDGSIYY